MRPHGTPLQAYRDDGPISCMLGTAFRGVIPALAPVLVAAAITGVLLGAGGGHGGGLALLAPVAVLLLAGPAATSPHESRLDWLVPPVIRGIEYGYLAVVGFAHGVPEPLVYTLIAVLAYHHYDIVYRTRQRLWPPEWVYQAGLGWDGRMLVAAIGALIGGETVVYWLLTVYLAALFGYESVSTWTRTERGGGVAVDLENTDGEEA